MTFDIDANGIVHVAAKDRATSKESKITITASSGMNKDDIDKAVREAKEHEAEDKARREEIEVRNRARVVASSGVLWPSATNRLASSTLRSSIWGRISVEKRRWSFSFSASEVSMV